MTVPKRYDRCMRELEKECAGAVLQLLLLCLLLAAVDAVVGLPGLSQKSGTLARQSEFLPPTDTLFYRASVCYAERQLASSINTGCARDACRPSLGCH